jgi:hypothetical protein
MVAASKGLPDVSVFDCLNILSLAPPIGRVPVTDSRVALTDVYCSVQDVTTMPTTDLLEPRSGDSVQENPRLRAITDCLVRKDNMGWSGWEEFRNLTPNDKTNLQEQE